MLKINESIVNLLLLTIDVGSSGSKIVFKIVLNGVPSKVELLWMEPELAESSREVIEDQYESTRISIPQPENEAWVEYDNECYVVGFLARDKRFNGTVELGNLKYEGAIPKVLAAVGAIANKFGLPDEFDLALTLPLPFNEWQDRKKFERAVTKALSSFNFRKRNLTVGVKFFMCVPEGGGLVITRNKKLGAESDRKKVIVIMIGYRDISVVISERGIITGKTEALGLAEMISLIISRTSGLDPNLLLLAIHQTGTANKAKSVEQLARSQKAGFKAEEANDIVEAIRKSRIEYWRRVSKWLDKYTPTAADEVVVGGGTAEYLKPELKTFCTKRFPNATFSWAAELEEDVRQAFNLAPSKDALCLRLTDAYGLYRYMQKQVLPYLNGVKKKA